MLLKYSMTMTYVMTTTWDVRFKEETYIGQIRSEHLVSHGTRFLARQDYENA